MTGIEDEQFEVYGQKEKVKTYNKVYLELIRVCHALPALDS